MLNAQQLFLMLLLLLSLLLRARAAADSAAVERVPRRCCDNRCGSFLMKCLLQWQVPWFSTLMTSACKRQAAPLAAAHYPVAAS